MNNYRIIKMCKIYMVAIIFFNVTNIYAQKSIKIPIEYKRVADYGEVLTHDERSLLDNILVHRSTKNSIDLFFITVKDYSENSIREYSERIINELSIGNNFNGEGILILLRPKTIEKKGEIYILQTKDNSNIPDVTLKLIIDNEIIPFFKENEIFKGIYNGITVIDQLLNNLYDFEQLNGTTANLVET